MALTLRERIMAELVLKFEAMSQPTYTTQFHRVERDVLDEANIKGVDIAVGLVDMEEVSIFEAGYVLKTLSVGIECWYTLRIGDNASTELNRIAGDVELMLSSDNQITETGSGETLAYNIRVMERTNEIEGPTDEIVSLYMLADVLYRHKAGDPTSLP